MYGASMWTKSPSCILRSDCTRLYVLDRKGMLQLQAELISESKSPDSQEYIDNNSLSSIPSIA